jgi:hypothetical protein
VLGIGFGLLLASIADLLYQRFASRLFPKLYRNHPSLLGARPQ